MMGQNFYFHENICETCGRSDEPIHIGKDSAGWCFALHVIGNLTSLDAWKARWKQPHSAIITNGDEVVSPEKMLAIITARQWPQKAKPQGYKDWAQFHAINHSEQGPNGLIRCRVEGTVEGHGCVGHGDGTWDLIAGEFC
jgi:hypothetical protein